MQVKNTLNGIKIVAVINGEVRGTSFCEFDCTRNRIFVQAHAKLDALRKEFENRADDTAN